MPLAAPRGSRRAYSVHYATCGARCVARVQHTSLTVQPRSPLRDGLSHEVAQLPPKVTHVAPQFVDA